MEPDPSKDAAAGTFETGRIVGGSGAINAMAYVRDTHADYGGWAAQGAEDWSYDQVLSLFQPRPYDGQLG
ncbi:GMC family oxidoreductase N-terminal domain-containing protein [Streptomyces mangrovisoli]|uniref:Glucose-methanol-choline oxidoreductase N-terminal domain-containing protein n=1 Tax=Streptomyces mangrovisoli TaxID=1428628 RepID=A0A1J4NRK4_9ACTN|nr:GMC family oxidoreductase N-terminal domain-containing protein [Streptomyces mangrovisoli]OIJ64947.1 hypothetical protein WN71_026015 [Streptomyces mangrovisoli]